MDNYDELEKENMHRFREFLAKNDIKIKKKDYPYRFYIWKLCQKRLKDLKKNKNSSSYEMDENEFCLLNDKEIHQKYGIGVDGDTDEYMHLLKTANQNPENLENYIKEKVFMKMKIIKHDKIINLSTNCEKNDSNENCLKRKKLENDDENPFEEGTLFYNIYELGGKDMLDVDWERDGFVSKVKNQLFCGSCWAFAITSSLESSYIIEKNKYIHLSEQELVNNNETGCDGGYMHVSLNYVKNNGLVQEHDLPYKGIVTEADVSDKKRYHMHDYVGIKNSSMLSFLSHLSFRPVTTAIGITEAFCYYSKGILDNTHNISKFGRYRYGGYHAVLAVGYYIDPDYPNRSYIRFKNTWGNQWGEHGYFRARLYNSEDHNKFPFGLAIDAFQSVYTLVNQISEN